MLVERPRVRAVCEQYALVAVGRLEDYPTAIYRCIVALRAAGRVRQFDEFVVYREGGRVDGGRRAVDCEGACDNQVLIDGQVACGADAGYRRLVRIDVYHCAGRGEPGACEQGGDVVYRLPPRRVVAGALVGEGDVVA